MAQAVEYSYRQGRMALMQWIGALAGPVAWALDEGISYMLTQHACSTGHFYVLHVMSLISLIICGCGFFIAQNVYRTLPENANDNGGSMYDRSHFMAIFGMVFSIAFAMVVIAMEVPKIILSPCD